MENPGLKPTFVLAPPAGSTVLFGGQVTHAGLALDNGQRCVFVASLSLDLEAALVSRREEGDETHGNAALGCGGSPLAQAQVPEVPAGGSSNMAALRKRMAEFEERAARMEFHNERMGELESSLFGDGGDGEP